ncbi:MAG TPA: hypothetical protein VJ826_16460 [Candidatus Polarisedimenticolaceae bacterium]|nr:hypothetical protein [Candidatus Polarisedimenticolaceae bacterium]
MSKNPVAITAFILGMVGSIAMFGFLAVAWWVDARRREREAFYRSEVLKKLAEAGAEGSATALEMFREQQRSAGSNRLETQRLGGLVLAAVGVGLMALLRGVATNESAWLSGLIPTLVGAVLLIYSYGLAPKPPR